MLSAADLDVGENIVSLPGRQCLAEEYVPHAIKQSLLHEPLNFDRRREPVADEFPKAAWEVHDMAR
jgi:hypothetical protein